MNNEAIKRLSYKDPDGYVIELHAQFYRVVYESFREDWEVIAASRILEEMPIVQHELLTKEKWPNELLEWEVKDSDRQKILCVFKLQTISPFVYPWEWTPAMLCEAAILTLEIQKLLLKKGLTLKDASFLNIQFIKGRPCFIDLLSFKKAVTHYPWHAYGQYLRHFFNPLALYRSTDIAVTKMLGAYPDGVDKDSAAAFLPVSTWFNMTELINVHLHKRLDNNKKNTVKSPELSLSKQSEKTEGLLDLNLGYLRKLKTKQGKKKNSDWVSYYEQDVEPGYHTFKKSVVSSMIAKIPERLCCVDLGANDGAYSELACSFFSNVISIEQDMDCCDQVFQKIKNNVYPKTSWTVICADLLNPTPSIGWLNAEHGSLISRINKHNTVLALALVHHLYFKGSIYFDQIINMFSDFSGHYVITEFISPSDKKVIGLSELNASRLALYTMANFKSEILKRFSIIEETPVSETRTVFFLKSNA